MFGILLLLYVPKLKEFKDSSSSDVVKNVISNIEQLHASYQDENGNEIHRDDANVDEIKRMMTDPDRFCRLWRSFNTVSKPYKWIVWPHSEKEGWVNRMEGTLYEKV